MEVGPSTRRRRYVERAGFLVRILALDSQRPVGTGFVVDDFHLLTCAHVINAALGRDSRRQDDPGPDVRVPVDFPILGDADGAPVRLCRVVRWRPPPLSGTSGDDIAGLAVVGEELPVLAGPARLPEDSRPQPGGEVYVFGHPSTPPRRSGSWVLAAVLGRVGDGMLQVDSSPSSAVRLQPGYSGSPLVRAGSYGDSVIGMLAVASSRDEHRDAYGVPIDRLVRAWPEVLAGIPPSPYRGLQPFGPLDEAVFVGREEDTDHLLGVLGDHTLALVVGPSGIGKSSLINAGVVPQWRAAGGVAVAVRPGPGSARPLERFLSDIDLALRSATGIDEWNLPADAPAAGLNPVVSRRAEAAGKQVLVHLDQFEELLGGTSPEDRRKLVDVLLPGPHDASPAARVVVTIRADFLPMLLELPGQGARLRDRMIALSPMGVAALRRAVSEPARARGVAYETGLAEQIAADASGGPGSLPLMEFTLAQLWQSQRGRRLTFADYRGFGGVTGAVNRHAERCYQRFRAEGRAAQVKAVMLALVRTHGGAAEAIGRAAPRRRFEATGLLIEELNRYRLLVVEPALPGQEDDEPLVRLAHESLIRSWERLAGWVDEDSEFQRWLATMEERIADDELLGDTRIGAAEHWLAERRADIPDEVVRLVERSRSAWQRRIAELEAARAAAVEAADRAQRAAAEADARRLAAASELATATSIRGGPLPLALAIESLATAWTFEGDSALRHAMRTAPCPVARLEDNGEKYARIRLSSTGDHLIRTVRDGSSDRFPQGLTEVFHVGFDDPGCHLVHREEMFFAPAGDAAVGLHNDGHRAVVVDLRTGRRLTADDGRMPIVSAAMSDDGKHLAVVRVRQGTLTDRLVRDAVVRVTDVGTGRVLHTRPIGDAGEQVTFNADFSMVALTAGRYDDKQHHRWISRTMVVDLTSARSKPIVLEHDGSAGLSLAFSPDNSLVAAGTNAVDSCGDAHGGAVEIFDLRRRGELRHRFPSHLPVTAVAFAPKGDHLAVALGDTRRARPGAGQLIDVRHGRETHRWDHDGPCTSVLFNADGSGVAIAGTFAARVFDVSWGIEYARADHEHDIIGMAFHSDGRRLRTVAAAVTGPVEVFATHGTEVSRIDDPRRLEEPLISAAGTVVFLTELVGPFTSFAEERVQRVHAVDTMTMARRLVVTHAGSTKSLATSADGTYLVTASAGTAFVHETTAPFTPHPDRAEPLVVDHPGCKEVLYAGVTADARRLVTIAGAPHGLPPAGEIDDRVHLSPYSGRARTLRVTDLRTGAAVATIGVAGKVMAVSPDGALAAMLVADEDAHLSFSDNSGTHQGTVVVLSTSDGAERLRLRARTNHSAVAIGGRPTGDHLESGPHGWIALLRDRSLDFHASTGGPRLRGTELPFVPHTITAGPGGARVAVRGFDELRGNVVAVVDTERASVLATFETDHWGTPPAFSPDGRRLAILRDRAAHVMDIATGTRLCAIEHGGDDPVFHAVFVGDDGRYLLTRDRRGLRVSLVETDDLLRSARALLTRNLTVAERQRHLVGTGPVAP
ncbi:trypsin-like peptidase domain-containing protein [Actinoplanes sp. NPDC089786]|uniref:nSTAND1 domain-containing NTPase n=1 Tax=Actinoplanes sp. NPDC089786 TaxID=3155185 RepID=UPI003425AEC5